VKRSVREGVNFIEGLCERGRERERERERVFEKCVPGFEFACVLLCLSAHAKVCQGEGA